MVVGEEELKVEVSRSDVEKGPAVGERELATTRSATEDTTALVTAMDSASSKPLPPHANDEGGMAQILPETLQQASTASNRGSESFLSDFRSRFPAIYRKILSQITVPSTVSGLEDGAGGLSKAERMQNMQEFRLERLLKSMQIGSLKRSDLLYDVGYQANEMYIIISGSVTLYRNVAADPRDLVVKLGPNQCFGEYSMVVHDCEVSWVD